MANQNHLNILKLGVGKWNKWRKKNPDIEPDLSGANLFKERLSGINFKSTNLIEANLEFSILAWADLRGADLEDAQIFHAHLEKANLEGSNLAKANLWAAHLRMANLKYADLTSANLPEADLYMVNLERATLESADFSRANLSEANLKGANLQFAKFADTYLKGANLSDSFVYGISAWNLFLENTIQSNLTITYQHRTPWVMEYKTPEPVITVDDIEIAQFLYLMLNNKKIRRIIDTITSKVVLILGRFTPNRKSVLDAMREELRKFDFLPIVFDFDKPFNRDTLETVLYSCPLISICYCRFDGCEKYFTRITTYSPKSTLCPCNTYIKQG